MHRITLVSICVTLSTPAVSFAQEASWMPEECNAQLQSNVRLSGTVYNSKRPERSLAILGIPSARRGTAVYRCGSRVGTYRLLEVRPRAVLLSAESVTPCWLRMTRGPAPKPKLPAPKRSSSRTGAFTSAELDQSIQRLQPNVYSVERALIDRAIGRASTIARRTRARPVQQHGAVVGLSLQRLPRDGLLSRLGLRRGDLLKTVNGFQIASIDGMLRARTQLASAPRLSLALVRGGQQITIEYRLH